MTATTAQKLAAARERLVRAENRAGVTSDRVGVPDDPGALSGIRRTTTARQARQSAAAVDRSVDAAVELTKAQEEVERLERQASNEMVDAHVRANSHADIDRLCPGDFIRYEHYGRPRGLGHVVRLNPKTVTIEAAPGMDQPKIAYDRIIGTTHQADQEVAA